MYGHRNDRLQQEVTVTFSQTSIQVADKQICTSYSRPHVPAAPCSSGPMFQRGPPRAYALNNNVRSQQKRLAHKFPGYHATISDIFIFHKAAVQINQMPLSARPPCTALHTN